MLKIKKLSDKGIIPTRSNDNDAGLDLYASRFASIMPLGGAQKVPTAIAIELPRNTVGLIWPRSKLSTRYKQMVLAGVIDQDYRGEIMVTLINFGSNQLYIHPGDKIAQLIIQPFYAPQIVVVDELGESERGEKGINCEDLRL